MVPFAQLPLVGSSFRPQTSLRIIFNSSRSVKLVRPLSGNLSLNHRREFSEPSTALIDSTQIGVSAKFWSSGTGGGVTPAISNFSPLASQSCLNLFQACQP